jgi:signal transduction histidine kinase
MVRDVTEQKRLRENMQFYISQITRAQEEERKRIARELHDETAQDLATLSLDIEAINKSRDQLSDEAIRHLEQLRGRVDSALEGVHRFSHALRPPLLDEVGLVPALESLVDRLNERGEINTCFVVGGTRERLSSEAELVLLRIAQESLHNVRRHSQATEAVVSVEFGPQKVRLEVTDNGKGFELPGMLSDFASMGKLGLLGMQERARLLGGSLAVESQVGKGTKVVVEVMR